MISKKINIYENKNNKLIIDISPQHHSWVLYKHLWDLTFLFLFFLILFLFFVFQYFFHFFFHLFFVVAISFNFLYNFALVIFDCLLDIFFIVL